MAENRETSIEEIIETYQMEGHADLLFPELTVKARKEHIQDRVVSIVIFDGKITNGNSYDLNKKLHRLFSGVTEATVLLDLSMLEYANSTGVAIFFSFYYRIRENRGSVLIGGFHPFLRRVFGLMDLPSDFRMFETLEDAKNAL